MKHHTITTYSYDELSEEAKDRAYQDYQEMVSDWDIPWQEETFDSLKALIEHAGFTLRDWSLGAYSRNNYIKVGIDDNVADLSGKRAMAWLENHVLGPCRIGWRPVTHPARRKCAASIRSYAPYHPPGSRYYCAPDMVKPCPFTGYVMDEVLLDALRKSLREGATVKDAFHWLADTVQDQLEAEVEHQQSREAFEQWAEDEEFTADGKRY